MALLKLGALVTQMSGKIGGQSISNRRGFTTIRNIVQTNKIPTAKQSKQRNISAQVSNQWQFLTSIQRIAWQAASVDYKYINRIGDEITRNGFQTFSFLNLNLKVIDVNQISDAPPFVPVSEPKINLIDISLGNFKIQSNNPSNVYLYALFGVANLSFGQTANKGLMRFIGFITSAQLTAGYDVVNDLENVFGVLSFPNKMAITIDPIDQSTGNRKQFVDIIENLNTPMILEITVADNQSVTIPFKSGGVFSGTVIYGDGTSVVFASWNDVNLTHTYVLGGVYTILILGQFPRFAVNFSDFSLFLTNILQFGSNAFTLLNFRLCTLLTDVTPNDTPSLINCNLLDLFNTCTGLTFISNIEFWDITSVNILGNIFNLSNKINPNVSNWNVSNVVQLSQSFAGASIFNQDLSSWDVSSCVNFLGMFNNASLFNGDVTTWQFKLTGSINFQNMFWLASSFNQDISGWNVERVTNFTRLVNACVLFNQNLSSWDIRLASTMLQFGNSANFSDANWDAMLNAWNALINPPSNINISINATHTVASQAAFDNLIATWGWTITENI